jgi:hypothetical protein
MQSAQGAILLTCHQGKPKTRRSHGQAEEKWIASDTAVDAKVNEVRLTNFIATT